MVLKIILVIGGLILGYALIYFFSSLLFRFFNGIRSTMVNYVNKQNYKYSSWKLLIYMSFCCLLMIGNNVVSSFFTRIPNLNEDILRIGGIVLSIIPLLVMLVKTKLYFPLVFIIKLLGLPIDVITYALYIFAHIIGVEIEEPASDITYAERRRIAEEDRKAREYYQKNPARNTSAPRAMRSYEVTVDGKSYRTHDNPDFNSRIHVDGEGFVDRTSGNEYTSSGD